MSLRCELGTHTAHSTPHTTHTHHTLHRVPDGELIERIIADNNLTEAVTVGYLGQLLSAVDTLHSLSIAHLDIRPENILLSGDTLKLIDFGSAKEMTSDLSPLYTSSVEFTGECVFSYHQSTTLCLVISCLILTLVDI